MENITRRNYLKLVGSLSCIILLNGLTGCSKKEASKEEIDYNKNEAENDQPKEGEIAYDENGVQNSGWSPTGNSKDFEPGEHFIYTIVSIKYKDNGQITIPEGYEYVSSETITSKAGYGSKTNKIKYNFINTVPINALEYINLMTDEIAFPFSGTVIQLEEEQTNQKTLK